MKLSYGWRCIILATFTIFYLSYGYLMVGIADPGKTPCNKLLKRGISSAMSLGTKVSHTDLNKIFCSNYSRSLPLMELMSVFYFLSCRIAYLFMLPAETRTLLRARSPKS